MPPAGSGAVTSIEALLTRCARLSARIDASELAIQAAARERLTYTTDQAEIAVLMDIVAGRNADDPVANYGRFTV